MPALVEHSSKLKVTVTLSPDLVREIDAIIEDVRGGSRSQLVEEALRRRLQDQSRKELERQTEAYYRSLSATERKEDRQWIRAAARSAKRLWDE
jgi:metal-responsive CopG/Arc/MetJ family transcriptional regulator